MIVQNTETYQFKENSDDLWLTDIRHIESPNFDERPENTTIDLLVIHAISLPPNQFGGEFIEQLFTNNLDPNKHEYFKEISDLKVSAHLLIDRKGDVTQFVPLNKRAWHAGKSIFCGREVCNDFSIGIELEGSDESEFETIQYEKLVKLTQFIQKTYPNIKKTNIVGHSDIAPGRKTDPGPYFDWDTYYNLLETENTFG